MAHRPGNGVGRRLKEKKRDHGALPVLGTTAPHEEKGEKDLLASDEEGGSFNQARGKI